jgi:hypothetical protein
MNVTDTLTAADNLYIDSSPSINSSDTGDFPDFGANPTLFVGAYTGQVFNLTSIVIYNSPITANISDISHQLSVQYPAPFLFVSWDWTAEFWQDAGKTIPATRSGDPVVVWSSASGDLVSVNSPLPGGTLELLTNGNKAIVQNGINQQFVVGSLRIQIPVTVFASVNPGISPMNTTIMTLLQQDTGVGGVLLAYQDGNQVFATLDSSGSIILSASAPYEVNQWSVTAGQIVDTVNSVGNIFVNGVAGTVGTPTGTLPTFDGMELTIGNVDGTAQVIQSLRIYNRYSVASQQDITNISNQISEGFN